MTQSNPGMGSGPALGLKTKIVLGNLQWPWAWAEVDRTGVLLDPKMLLDKVILRDKFIKGQLRHTTGANDPFEPCPIRTWKPRSQSRGVIGESRPVFF